MGKCLSSPFIRSQFLPGTVLGAHDTEQSQAHVSHWVREMWTKNYNAALSRNVSRIIKLDREISDWGSRKRKARCMWEHLRCLLTHKSEFQEMMLQRGEIAHVHSTETWKSFLLYMGRVSSNFFFSLRSCKKVRFSVLALDWIKIYINFS